MHADLSWLAAGASNLSRQKLFPNCLTMSNELPTMREKTPWVTNTEKWNIWDSSVLFWECDFGDNDPPQSWLTSHCSTFSQLSCLIISCMDECSSRYLTRTFSVVCFHKLSKATEWFSNTLICSLALCLSSSASVCSCAPSLNDSVFLSYVSICYHV